MRLPRVTASRKTARVFLMSGIFLLSEGCFLQKKPVVQAPVTAPPAPASVPAVTTTPSETEPAPAPVQAAPTPPPAVVAPRPAAPAAPPAKPSPFPPSSSAPPTPVRPAPVPAPSLGAILSPDQRQRLEAAYQSDLNQANAALNSLNRRTLTPQQTDTVNRARAFIRQAAQYHGRDLTTAAELARRARVLAQDLAGAH